MMNAPNRFGVDYERWKSKEHRIKEKWELLSEEAKEIVYGESSNEDYSKEKVGDLMNERFHCSMSASRLIPEYFRTEDYYQHGLKDWIKYHRFRKRQSEISETMDENLGKYGMGDFSTPSIYKIDDQYVRLREKPLKVVKRFHDFNRTKLRTGLWDRLLGGGKAEINCRASRRVLVEAGTLGAPDFEI
ncbi:MAG: hypothetical protein ABIF88_01135 [archaeon]